MKNLLALFVFFLFISYAHSQVLTGTVVNNEGLALPDAIVYTSNYKDHAHTGLNGRFRMEGVNKGDTLNVQYIGYESYNHVITDNDMAKGLRIIMSSTSYTLDQVYIDNSMRSVSTINRIDLTKNPVNSSQEILRKVPGLFIAQHAGGGKAEQIFLRGFDIDHGTDIAISVDGMPVNMVSHAHGQGYADLHFLIPETIENIDFGKGPYRADKGNLNTAGYVEFRTRDRLENSVINVDIGDFNTIRSAMALPVYSGDSSSLYVAGEYLLSDGPFVSSQNFNRLNLMTKYTTTFAENSQLSVSASQFTSSWDASGQIPQRLVDDGSISRFGAVDDTEGGRTSRTNLTLEYHKPINEHSYTKTNLYYSKYDFELYSNFTFFLNDPVNGDQIRQREDRNMYGIQSRFFWEKPLSTGTLELSGGIGFRYDDINDSELSRTKNRQETLERISLGNIDESNLYSFVDAKYSLGDWTINPSLRLDHFNFEYNDLLSVQYSNSSISKTIVLPKLNITYNPGMGMQLYLRSGKGFHSNDSRVITGGITESILPAAYSVDLGTIWKPLPDLWINTAIWFLHLDQEFVYVGDEGIVEPSGRSQRKGLELSLRYQALNNLYVYSDFNYTIARSIDEPEGMDYIPLAPDLTVTSGISYTRDNWLTAGLNSRYIKNRPANEDNSIEALGYFVMDFNIRFRIAGGLSIGCVIENIMDTEWNEAQFATESRLFAEADPVEEIHFTPGVPRFIKGQLSYRF